MVEPDKNTLAIVRRGESAPTVHAAQSWDDRLPRMLDAGVDNVYFSYDVMVSDDTWFALLGEQDKARAVRDERRAVYISEWLNAQVSPMGASGYPIVLMSDDWLIRLQTSNDCQPGIYIEMRSFVLHTHPGGVLGACEDVCRFIREKLLADAPMSQALVTLKRSRCSRLDLHCDWQGGWHPSMEDGEVKSFIKPGHTGWNKYMQGNDCLGYTFGKKRIQARLYNKTKQATTKHLDWYSTYIAQRGGAAFNPSQDIWRLEFELKRAGIKGFRLDVEQEIDDTDEIVESEIACEDLQGLDTVIRAVRWSEQLWSYLTRHWLRLVMVGSDNNRARWALHPTWATLQDGYAPCMGKPVLAEAQTKLVRSERHSGYGRAVTRQAVGLMVTAEAMIDGDAGSAVIAFFEQVQRVAEGMRRDQVVKDALKKAGKEDGRQGRYLANLDALSKGALGCLTSAGVTKSELPPFTCAADLLEFFCDDFEDIAREKGGIGQMVNDKWCKLHKALPPKGMFTLAS